ncbi:hypothetical protein FB45DRAFT_1006795 [Roridomyces roridus]|uniref:Uncharacterized protein n=1 Tax=Roridomyces roridus TaxID=1738132 RepID=A0AAD7BFZ4_9AGAR|nr:hypothetical protein FB45DRAFT_1006795 [Roridomyces roridus]
MLVAPVSSRRYRDDVPPPAIQLPRTLARPAFTDISREALAAASPDLDRVPAEFVRHGLLAKATQMQAGIAALAPSHLPQSIPKSHLPRTLTIPLRVTSVARPSYPTHVLAITASSSKSPRESVGTGNCLTAGGRLSNALLIPIMARNVRLFSTTKSFGTSFSLYSPGQNFV